MITDESIVSFLKEQGETDEEEIQEWIDAFREDSGEGESFESYYETTNDQIEMFSNVDWDSSDSDISFQLSQAYLSYLARVWSSN
jgi:hypothetical protein